MVLSPKFQLRLVIEPSPSLLPSVKLQLRLVQLAVNAAVGATLPQLETSVTELVASPSSRRYPSR